MVIWGIGFPMIKNINKNRYKTYDKDILLRWPPRIFTVGLSLRPDEFGVVDEFVSE